MSPLGLQPHPQRLQRRGLRGLRASGLALSLSLSLSLSLGLLVAVGPAQAHDQKQGHEREHGPGLTAELEARRQGLLQATRQALAQADRVRAQRLLDEAAPLLHAPDTESLQVLLQLQAGELRLGLNFAAHTAGAHPDSREAVALYSWLLALAGQNTFALRQIDQALALQPDDLQLSALRQAIAALSGPRSKTWTEPSHLPHPVSAGAEVPREARPAGAGLLLRGGRLALVAGQVAPATGLLWVRNGLGQAVAARCIWKHGQDLALLELTELLPGAGTLQAAPRDPFPGSQGQVLSFLPQADSGARWPALSQGFIGMPPEAGTLAGLLQLGLEPPPGARSGPVFDAAGRVTGLALPAASASIGPALLPLSALQARLHAGLAVAESQANRAALEQALASLSPSPADAGSSAAAPPGRLSHEQAFERGLPLSLLVFRLD